MLGVKANGQAAIEGVLSVSSTRMTTPPRRTPREAAFIFTTTTLPPIVDHVLCESLNSIHTA